MCASERPPLDGLRVLELGSFIAGPFATRILGDYGAEVIKVERPETGDELRGWRRMRGDTSMMFRTLARNKRSVTLDLQSTEGRSVLEDLVRASDVVIENFRPGTLERWDLGPDRLRTINPDIVLVRISGFGQTGPYKDRAGFGGVAEAFGGLRYITGYPDRESVRPGAPIGDVLAGLYAAVSALTMLHSRTRGAGVQHPKVADVALYEAVFMALESLVPDFDAYDVVRERTAGALPGVVPSGIYPTADGSVMIAGNSSGVFGRLMTAVGRPDFADDPSLSDGTARTARECELNDAITTWTSCRRTIEVVKHLGAEGIPVGEVYSAAQIAVDDHFRAREMLQSLPVRIEDDRIEDVRFPGVVPQFDGMAMQVRAAGPDLGEHTDEVLSETLGYTAAHIDDLKRRGIV